MLLATVLLDPSATLMAGAILALISMKLLPKSLEEVWRVGLFSAVWGFTYGIAVGWFFFFRADWMFVYLLDASTIPKLPAYLLFLAICTVFGFVGGLGTAVMVHLKKTALAWLVTVFTVVTQVTLAVITGDQYGRVGTTAEYLAGTAKALSEDAAFLSALQFTVLLAGLVSVGILVLQVRRMRAP